MCFADEGFSESPFADFALSEGPAAILAAYQAGTIDDIVESLSGLGVSMNDGFLHDTSLGYLLQPLTEIWEQRKTKPPPGDASHWRSILDVIYGEHDTCLLTIFL